MKDFILRSDRIIQTGDIVRHFKKEMKQEYENSKRYLYEVLWIALDTTNDIYVYIYKSLATGELYTREIAEFLSEVDHKKYPDIKQKYRFEKVEK